jgi:hypothetical protein
LVVSWFGISLDWFCGWFYRDKEVD